MAKQIILTGNTANDGTGDPLRTAFTKVNDNFTEVYETAQAAFDYANTIVSDTQIDPLARSTANLALETANNLVITVDSISNTVNNITINAAFEFIEITGVYEGTGNVVSFSRPANTNFTDSIDTGITFARANVIGGIYNIEVESEWNELVSPANTSWNWSGWGNLTDVTTRQYRTFKQALKNRIGNNIIGAELVMRDEINQKYYKIKFTEWSQGGGGGFAYTRELINTQERAGVEFPDGSVQFTAARGYQDWPIVDVHDVDYTITPLDIDRSILSFDNTIYIPRDSDANFPIGATIFLLSGPADVIVERVQHIGEVEAELYVSGYSNGRASVTIPQRSLTILTKTAPNTWFLVPTKIPTDVSQLTDTSNTYISVAQLKTIAANSATYTDFQNNIALL
jgi:hypothetical protein